MRLLFAALSCAMLAGCGIVKDEVGRTGGAFGAAADRFIPARTPRQQADRYVTMALMLAPIALETAYDPDEAASTIRRVNTLYGSLADYYDVVRHCQQIEADTEKAPLLARCEAEDNADLAIVDNGYALETLANELQNDLYYVARATILNLDLKVGADKLLSLNPTALTNIWGRLDDLLPVFRRSAALYRDGIVLFADISQATCGDNSAGSCQELRRLMRGRFQGDTDNNSGMAVLPDRDIRRMLELGRAAFRAESFELAPVHYRAIVRHIDRACATAYRRMVADEGTDSNAVATCGDPADHPVAVGQTAPTSNSRQRFMSVVGIGT